MRLKVAHAILTGNVPSDRFAQAVYVVKCHQRRWGARQAEIRRRIEQDMVAHYRDLADRLLAVGEEPDPFVRALKRASLKASMRLNRMLRIFIP